LDISDYSAETAEKTVSILVISPFEEDHTVLAGIFSEEGWKVHYACTCEEAVECLFASRISVVICDHGLPACGWREVQWRIESLAGPPTLIVAHRLGDDSLWALWVEAMDLGARDLLLKPFDRSEVLWTVRSALRHGRTGCAQR
jgi:DNA-binding response OmpR family regulator